MGKQAEKQPPAFVVIDGELFYEFDRWRTLQGYHLRPVEETDGWILRLTRTVRTISER